jgi:hypothetical protein
MPQQLERPEVEAMIRAKLVELIQLAAEHAIDIQTLIYKTLARCDPEPP